MSESELRERVARIVADAIDLVLDDLMDVPSELWADHVITEQPFVSDATDEILALLEPAEPVAWRVQIDGGEWWATTIKEKAESEAARWIDDASIIVVEPLYTRGTDDE